MAIVSQHSALIYLFFLKKKNTHSESNVYCLAFLRFIIHNNL